MYFVIFLILLLTSSIASDIRFRGISGPLPALSLLTQEISKASRHVRAVPIPENLGFYPGKNIRHKVQSGVRDTIDQDT